jgi:N-acyl-D-amino-acid deacylase
MGGAFHHLVSPRPIELPLRFHESFAMSSCGAWNELIATPVDRKAALAADPAWRERARRDWQGAVFSKRTDGMRIVEVGRSELDDWIGRSLADLVAQRGGDSSDVLADWLIENGFASSFVFPVSNLDLDAVADMLVADGNLISGSDAGAHYKMFCGAGDTSLILQRHVRERGDLTLEDAVKRMTSDQARVMGMADRGTIAAGAIADLVVFRLDEIDWQREYYVGDVPGGSERLTRPAGGFLYTIVAGKITQRGGVYSGLLAGQLIERAATTVPA